MTTWADFHKASEEHAIQAHALSRDGKALEALEVYAHAARLEQEALNAVDPAKNRTKGITAVSAVALWYKAEQYDRAEQLAYAMLADPTIPTFARKDLRDLVQAIWTESAKQSAAVGFLPGQVLVSVKGGEVITGGAPLDLIVEKVQTIQAMFYRTVEFVKDLPLRTRGAAPHEIQESCRPWLFQAAPGSYQFAIAIQEPKQRDFFKEEVAPDLLAQQFLHILRATASEDPQEIESVVSKPEYRKAFLNLARNLAPTGASFGSIEFRTPAGGGPVSITSESRAVINDAIRRSRPKTVETSEDLTEEFFGILRAVDLEDDSLTVVVEGQRVAVTGLEDAMDDVIGPMVNKKVKLTALRGRKGLRFRDIELTD
jgi:hypothetical protein